MSKQKDFSNIEITDNLIKQEFYKNQRINSALVRNINNHPKIIQYLKSRFTDNRTEISYHEQIYRIIHDIEIIPRCPICGDFKQYMTPSGAYKYKTCGKKQCADAHMLLTFNARYGSSPGLGNENIRNKITNTIISTYGVSNVMQSPEIHEKRLSSVSKEEINLGTLLKTLYPNIKYQYKSQLYNYFCDFYIPEYDLYIEYHGSFYHNGKKFNLNNDNDVKQLREYELKNTRVYNNKIYTWTILDIQKYNCAKQNKLNYLVIYPYIQGNRQLIRNIKKYNNILLQYFSNVIEQFKHSKNLQIIIGENKSQ